MSNKINPRIEQAIKESIAETRIVTVKVADLQEALGGDDFRLRLRKA